MTDKECLNKIAELAKELDIAGITYEEALEALKDASFNEIAEELWTYYCFVRDIKSVLMEIEDGNRAKELLEHISALFTKEEVIAILTEIRLEIDIKYGHCDICEYFEDYDYEENDISEYRPIGDISDILQIIDKYKIKMENT